MATRTARLATKWVSMPVLVAAERLADVGANSYQLTQSRRFRPVIPGVRAHPDITRPVSVPFFADDDWTRHWLTVEALQLKMPDAVLSHISAMRLYGLPVPDRIRDDRIDLVSPTRPIRRAGVRRRAPTTVDSIQFCGIKVAAGDGFMRQLAGLLTEEELVIVLDAVCGSWRGPPLTTVENVKLWSDGWTRVRGQRTFARALERVRPGVGSPRETELRLLIVEAGLPEPEVAHPVSVGRYTFHPDLSYPHLLIAIEYEGSHHLTGDDRFDQWDHDIERERLMRDAGWDYIRVTKRTAEKKMLEDLERRIRARSQKFK